MNKTAGIRLFCVLTVLICCVAYGGGYYFSIYQSEKNTDGEVALKTEASEEEQADDTASQESAVAAAVYEFVLCEEDGYIVIYYADKETVYADTDIQLEHLPDRLQLEIKEGKLIYSERELYNFLESYSS